MSKLAKNRLHLGKVNFILLFIAAILLIVGYYIMSLNEISVSVLILVFTYIVIIPFALMYQPKHKEDDPSK